MFFKSTLFFKQNFLAKLNFRKQYTPLAIFFLLIFLLIISFPGNRSEADDAFWYANSIKSKEYNSLFNNRFLFFLPFFKALYDCVALLYSNVDPYLFMCVISVICSVGTLFLCFTLLLKYLVDDKRLAIIICGLILFSYNFWRYAVEAEVYAISNLLVCLTLFWGMRSLDKQISLVNLNLLSSAICAGISILFYKLNFIPTAICIPCIYLFKKRFKSFIVFQSISAAVVLAGFYLAYTKCTDHAENFIAFLIDSHVKPTGESRLMSLVVFIDNIVSENFAFGIDWVESFIHRTFPERNISEEVYAGNINGAYNYVALTTFILFGLSFFYLVKVLYKSGARRFNYLQVTLVLWVILYLICIAYLDPTSPEPYVMVIVPFWLFISSWIGAGIRKSKLLLQLYTVAGLLFFHNLIGGYAIIKNKKSDYQAFQASWVISHTNPGDVVLCEWPKRGLINYIRYYSPANIIWQDVEFQKWVPCIEKALNEKHRLYLLTIREDNIIGKTSLDTSWVGKNRKFIKRALLGRNEVANLPFSTLDIFELKPMSNISIK